ncbi:MAG: HEPN domain-containing protein [Actinomycetota bacterium]|nr:HEPN domain-containing protein [Actinomycetota bacterium]
MTPGQAESARAELKRAGRAHEEARLLHDADSLEGAVSRLYYAVFHAARAALLVRGRSSRTHSGQITLFTETYGAAPILGRLRDLRARADYELGELVVSGGMVGDLLGEARAFIDRCGRIVAEATERGADDPDPPPDR